MLIIYLVSLLYSMNVVFWQPVKSPHVLYLASHLRHYDLNVYYVVVNKKEDSHKNLGWDVIDEEINNLKFIFNEIDLNEIDDDIFNPSTIHITSGMNSNIIPSKYIKKIKKSSGIWIFMCEKFKTNDFLSFFRYLNYFIKLKISRNKPDYFFSISSDAFKYLKNLFINPKLIFPFAYFIKNNFSNTVFSNSNDLRILFIGNLIKRKNIIQVLKILKEINNPHFKFNIIGNGKEYNNIKNLIEKSSLLKANVTLVGTVDNILLSQHFSNTDLFILPSSFDGWGVVATESIMSGVPVLISKNCGAKDLIDITKVGSIYNTYNDMLLNMKYYMMNKIEEKDRNYLKKIGNKFSSENGAFYLFNLLMHIKHNKNKPAAPWEID